MSENNQDEDDNTIIEKVKLQRSLLETSVDYLQHLIRGGKSEEYEFPETIVQLIDFPVTLSDSNIIIENCANFTFPFKKKGLQASISWLWSGRKTKIFFIIKFKKIFNIVSFPPKEMAIYLWL